MDETTATAIVAELRAASEPLELPKIRKRLAYDEDAFGLRMGDLFSISKTHTTVPLTEVLHLLDHPAYEPRMAGFCILDFKARKKLTEDQRRELYEVYLDRHDRITTWDMVDRAAPHVVGGYLAGRSTAPLHDLATSSDPLRRRTAMTAPLYFVKKGTDAELEEGFALAATLAGDADPIVHKPVGIFLKHAGTRDETRLREFLDEHATVMPRAALRLAVEKLNPDDKAAYVS